MTKITPELVKSVREFYVPASREFGIVNAMKKYHISQITFHKILDGYYDKILNGYYDDNPADDEIDTMPIIRCHRQVSAKDLVGVRYPSPFAHMVAVTLGCAA